MEFPNDKKDLMVSVFYMKSMDPFITGVEGAATINLLEEIEQQLVGESDPIEYDTFDSGEGDYLFKATYEPADEGTAGYWELEQLDFKLLPEPDLGQDDRYAGPY